MLESEFERKMDELRSILREEEIEVYATYSTYDGKISSVVRLEAYWCENRNVGVRYTFYDIDKWFGNRTYFNTMIKYIKIDIGLEKQKILLDEL